jgi:hypothetical protein
MKNRPVYLCPICYKRGKLHDRYIEIERERQAGVKFTPKSPFTCIYWGGDSVEYPMRDLVYLSSQDEYAFFLKHLWQKPVIKEMEIHPTFNLGDNLFYANVGNQEGFEQFGYPFLWTYTADFSYINSDDEDIVVDVKGDVEKKTGQPYIRPKDRKKYMMNCFFMEQMFPVKMLTYSSGLFWRWKFKWDRTHTRIVSGKLEVME